MGGQQSRQPQPSVSPVELISRWNLEPRERLIFDRGRLEITQYLEAVHKVVHQSASREERDQVIPMAVSRLKHEFERVLGRQSEMVSNSTTELSTTTITDTTTYRFWYEASVDYEAPSKDVTEYLRNIAQTMNSCGHLQSCIEVYQSMRRLFVQNLFRKLKLDELNAGGDSEELKMKIDRWIEAAKACTKKLFKKEKQFAADIFSGLGGVSTHVECFLNVAKDSAVRLFSFAKDVSSRNQPSERLNIVLTLYGAMISLEQDVHGLFPSEQIRNSIATTSSKLGDEVKRMLSGFEDSVLNDENRTSDDDGGQVLILTKHVIDSINAIMNHKEILMNLIVSKPSKIVEGRNLPNDLLREPNNLSPLGLHLVLIIAVLQLNLVKKSKNYKDPSLAHLFMMNNINHIVLGIKASRNLQQLIGVEFQNKLNMDLRGAMAGYQEKTCDKLLNCLREEELYASCCCISRVSTSALRRSIINFNAAFDNICSLQSHWAVNDHSLKEEIRRSMLEKLKPAYQQFLDRFKIHLEGGQESNQKIENLVEKLFSLNQPLS